MVPSTWILHFVDTNLNSHKLNYETTISVKQNNIYVLDHARKINYFNVIFNKINYKIW